MTLKINYTLKVEMKDKVISIPTSKEALDKFLVALQNVDAEDFVFEGQTIAPKEIQQMWVVFI